MLDKVAEILPHQARLPYAGHHDAPLAPDQKVNGTLEPRIQALDQMA